jgi:Domain of unknown function (DUF4157)
MGSSAALPLGANFRAPLAKASPSAQNSWVEHETPVPELAGRPRPRPARPTVELTHEVSRSEQSVIAGAGGAPATALRASAISLQRTAGNAAVTALLERTLAEGEVHPEPSPVLDIVGKGRGQPLDPGLREEMEARIGEDFSDVRIHDDAPAAASAVAVSARAYTVGHEIVFGDAAPALHSSEGKQTLAHELTHVVQQRRGPVTGTPTGDGIAISHPSDRFEQAAEANAARVMADRRIDDRATAATASLATQRQVDEEVDEYEEEAAEYQEEAAEAQEEGAELELEEAEEGGEEEEEEG